VGIGNEEGLMGWEMGKDKGVGNGKVLMVKWWKLRKGKVMGKG
jgi:hypothetical protein